MKISRVNREVKSAEKRCIQIIKNYVESNDGNFRHYSKYVTYIKYVWNNIVGLFSRGRSSTTITLNYNMGSITGPYEQLCKEIKSLVDEDVLDRDVAAKVLDIVEDTFDNSIEIYQDAISKRISRLKV